MSALRHEIESGETGRTHLRLVEQLAETALAQTAANQSELLENSSLLGEIESKSTPVGKLSLVVNHFDELKQEVDDPESLIDTASHDTLEWLELLDKEAARKAGSNPQNRIPPGLGFNEILSCLYAWELHPTDETEALARLAIDHAAFPHTKKSYLKAFETVKAYGDMTIDSALVAVAEFHRNQISVEENQVDYPWLFDASVPAPFYQRETPAGNKADVDPTAVFN